MGILPIPVQTGKFRENGEQVWSVIGHGRDTHLHAAVLVVSSPCSQDDLPDQERSASIGLERRVLEDPYLESHFPPFHQK